VTFSEIVSHFRSVAAAQRRLGLGSRQTLYNWRRKGVPTDQQIRIHRLTRGRLKAKLPRGITIASKA
jgi:hypothetical protein